MSAKRVIVVGGGLAAMAAAVALESAGISVTLLESRRSLGGRAGSFEDPQTGEILDNCQHVLLGCCTNLLDFYGRIGATDLIRFERTIHFRTAGGRRYDLGGMRLPAPLHLAASFATFAALKFRERIEFARAMRAMLRLGRGGRRELAEISFGQWLDQHGISASLIEKMFDPILVGALNEKTRDASAMYAIEVFQDAMLANCAGYQLGLPNCPLSRLYEKIPCKDVRLGVRVADVRFDGARAVGVRLSSNENIDGDAVVLATNYQTVERWIPPELAGRDGRFARLSELESVPILGAHLWFDRPMMRESHAALIGGPLQWLFRKDQAGHVLHGVISAARDWVGRPKEECLEIFQRQIGGVLPEAAGGKLLRGVIVVEKRATYSPRPGVDRLRPAQGPPDGGIENLFLAGDYTQTGWPATMEGAVRSGYLTAEALLRRFDIDEKFVRPDLPVQWPAAMMGLNGRGN